MMTLGLIMLIVFFYLSISVLYSFIFSVGGRFGKLETASKTGMYRKFLVLIPSYKEDEVIIESAKQALNQTYPKDKYVVMVIADSLQESTIAELISMPIKVLEVSFNQSTKAKSINAALSVLPNGFDYVLILDADNIMAPDFIEKVNASFVSTCAEAVQGHRVAKNLNTNFAILDAISEEINNHIYRKGHRALGLSSGLIGSGMAFEYDYFKSVMSTIHAVGGFDKELELKLLRDGARIEYVEDALVYDEKVEDQKVFQNQRKRWMSAQLHYFKKYFLEGIWHLIIRKNVNFFDKAFQLFLLPRVLLIGLVMVCTLASVICEFALGVLLNPGANFWMAILFLNVAGLMMAIPDHYYNKRTLLAVLTLPKAIGLMVLALFKLRGANRKFIHTPHKAKMNTSGTKDVESKKAV
jgi:cellulose synthase/poly-beta-1,6-N-acetylglucosamine synthase-like glycosyltransferase